MVLSAEFFSKQSHESGPGFWLKPSKAEFTHSERDKLFDKIRTWCVEVLQWQFNILQS